MSLNRNHIGKKYVPNKNLQINSSLRQSLFEMPTAAQMVMKFPHLRYQKVHKSVRKLNATGRCADKISLALYDN